MDIPNERSSHSRPIPRGGGIAIVATLALALVAWRLVEDIPLPGLGFFIAFGIVVLVSFVDDRKSLPASIRFLLQGIAAAIIVWETHGLDSFPLPEAYSLHIGWLGYPLAWFWIVAVMNIYNFMDGINGYAASQAALAGVAVVILDPVGVGGVLGLIIAAAALGFLVFNFGKATIFLGDVGSISLGFLFASLPFYFRTMETASSVFWMIMILWFFLADGAFTLLRRLYKREKIWEAHRQHYFQRLVDGGWSHQKTVLSIMSASVLLFIVHFYINNHLPSYSILSLGVALLLMVLYWWLARFKFK